MKVPPIETEEEYDAALLRLDKIFEAPEGSRERAEAEALLEAIEEYEEEHPPIGEGSRQF
jgi:HTH-type transcriptional regulator / antitoxin HigA